jgi:hypothetical protein
MTPALILAVLLSLCEPGTPRADLKALAKAVAVYPADEAAELLAIAWVESRWRHAPKRSHAGACCYMGILGGRYGAPSCRRLEKSPRLCVQTARKELAYWKRHCGEAYLDGYNAGWSRCWDGPQKHRAKCTTKCRDYSRKVHAKAAEITERLRAAEEGE